MWNIFKSRSSEQLELIEEMLENLDVFCIVETTPLDRLEQKFKSRFHSYRDGDKHNKPKPEIAKAWKRAWLDVKKEQRRTTQ